MLKLNIKGWNEMRRWPSFQAMLKEHAETVCATAGEGYVIQSRMYPDRAGYVVYPDTEEAKKDNYKNNTLLKALGGG